MSKSISLLSALLCTLIWGTTFIAQETGMKFIGPYVFNSVRFFVGFLAILPFVFLFEMGKITKTISKDKTKFFCYSILIGVFLFLGMSLLTVGFYFLKIAAYCLITKKQLVHL